MFRVALWMSTLIALAGARIYERCELARDLQTLGVHKDQIATWVCIAYHESRYDTAARNPASGDHGLFQISELYWCGPGKACGAPCSAFRDEDISDDVNCALKVYREHTRLQGDGFLAWVVYPHHCKHNAKKYTVDCNRNDKNAAMKFEDRSRYLKLSEANDTRAILTNNPYVNQLRPRYLAINSVFQGSYINEFEKNYYDNNKESLNWLHFKVDNIDDLKLPANSSENQPRRLIETSTSRTSTTTADPALIGIKPPTPRKIESNQFRRRKTFSESQVLKNTILIEHKNSKITPTPEKEKSETKPAFNEDLSHNIFLNLSPSIISKSIELSPDLSRYRIKKPEAEETSSNKILTYDDLAQNPFLKSLPGFNFKSTSKVLNHISSTHKPIIYSKNGPLRYPEAYDNLQGFKKSSTRYDESATSKVLSYEDLSQNIFLSHILKPSSASPLHEIKFLNTSEIDKKELIVTSLKPSTFLESSKDDILLDRQDVWIKPPNKPSVERSHIRYFSNIDHTTEKSSTQSLRPFDTRNTNIPSNNLTTVSPNKGNTPELISTAINHSNADNTYRKSFQIESTTVKPLATFNNSWSKLTEENRVTIRPHNLSRSRTTSRPWTTSFPHSSKWFSTVKSQDLTPKTPKPNYKSRTPTIFTSSSITTRPYYATTEKVVTDATTARTTQSIFDLYLKPTTRPAFTPFAFTSSINRLSIFSDGTTRSPPSYYNSNRREITDEAPKS